MKTTSTKIIKSVDQMKYKKIKIDKKEEKLNDLDIKYQTIKNFYNNSGKITMPKRKQESMHKPLAPKIFEQKGDERPNRGRKGGDGSQEQLFMKS